MKENVNFIKIYGAYPWNVNIINGTEDGKYKNNPSTLV